MIVAWVLWPALALASPKVAVVPLAGDTGGKVAAVVDAAAAAHAKVTSTKVVAKALKDLSITDPDNARAAKRLRTKLGVDAVIYGTLERDGAKKKLRLSIYTRGKKPAQFSVEYKLSSSKAFKDALREELKEKLAPDDAGNDDDDDAPRVEAKVEPRVEAKPEPRQPEASDDAPPPKRTAARKEDPGPAPKRTAARSDDDSDDDSASVHVRVRHHKAALANRDLVTQAAVFVDGGGGGVHRSLTYTANAGGTTPPAVGTAAFAAQLDGELYPGAFDSLAGTAAALGLYGSASKSFGLAIAIPGATQSSAISEATYTFGARYRFAFGQSSFAIGAAFWNQSYTANRSTLLMPTQLNMPDVDYKAIAPGVLLRLAASPKVGIALQADLPLMLASGAISEPSNLGAASVISFAFKASLDVALDAHYGLHFTALVDQVDLSFKAGPVGSAADRTIGAAATFALMY